MSSLSALLLVSFSLGLSNFAAAIGIGMGGIDTRARWRIALVFGFFEAAMPIIGLLLGQGLAGSVGEIGHFFGAGLLVLTGAYTLWQAWKSNQGREAKAASNPHTSLSRLLLAGLALSLDNLVVGFALSFSQVSFLLAGGVIALVSVGMSLVGLELGNHFGKQVEEWSDVFSGIILMLVGLAIGFGLL